MRQESDRHEGDWVECVVSIRGKVYYVPGNGLMGFHQNASTSSPRPPRYLLTEGLSVVKGGDIQLATKFCVVVRRTS